MAQYVICPYCGDLLERDAETERLIENCPEADYYAQHPDELNDKCNDSQSELDALMRQDLSESWY